jgi:prolyl-tRNA editing enzyme YbaK/EbsC (Cys-tRNA(Pro) deacylase)
MAETRGTTDLRRAGIEHRLLAYRYTGTGPVAAEAAAALGVDAAALFKTLVVVAGDEPVFALVPQTTSWR